MAMVHVRGPRMRCCIRVLSSVSSRFSQLPCFGMHQFPSSDPLKIAEKCQLGVGVEVSSDERQGLAMGVPPLQQCCYIPRPVRLGPMRPHGSLVHAQHRLLRFVQSGIALHGLFRGRGELGVRRDHPVLKVAPETAVFLGVRETAS